MNPSTELTDALAFCLDALERKELSIQECLDLYPQHAEELSALLGKFEAFRSLPLETARSEFSKKGYQELLNAIKDHHPISLPNRILASLQELVRPRQRKLSPVQIIAAAILAFTLVSGGVAYASDAAAPGDMLYGLDRAIERARLRMTTDVEDAIALRLEFAEERLKEIEDRITADDIDNAQEALGQYENEIEALEVLVASSEGSDDLINGNLIDAALAKNVEVLERVLEKVPEQAQEAIQKAIEKQEVVREKIKDKVKPEKPDKPGKPDKPEKTEKPEEAE